MKTGRFTLTHGNASKHAVELSRPINDILSQIENLQVSPAVPSVRGVPGPPWARPRTADTRQRTSSSRSWRRRTSLQHHLLADLDDMLGREGGPLCEKARAKLSARAGRGLERRDEGTLERDGVHARPRDGSQHKGKTTRSGPSPPTKRYFPFASHSLVYSCY